MAFSVFTNGRPLFRGPFSFHFPNGPKNDLHIVSEDALLALTFRSRPSSLHALQANRPLTGLRQGATKKSCGKLLSVIGSGGVVECRRAQHSAPSQAGREREFLGYTAVCSAVNRINR
jgi:hypothetical protein